MTLLKSWAALANVTLPEAERKEKHEIMKLLSAELNRRVPAALKHNLTSGGIR
ncbi:hypothetical protein GCM10014715_72150 [Streptomyces spiralis]|uniref:Uncharacterized protein n=1 Tax=Streptomyces spiralis TaxID=66376 RepID=A0A919AH08_9ACTN|nr:hypothetical protein [Streptomyces spiralis]GHF05650.1 hypothetical protein GCM10014715_72150 [Streptomyces spiralis]